MSPVPGASDLERKNAYWIEFGKQEERERIIKLLEERSKCGYEHDYNGYCYCEELALIKGENK